MFEEGSMKNLIHKRIKDSQKQLKAIRPEIRAVGEALAEIILRDIRKIK